MLNQALTAAPGQKECDSAVRNVEAMAHVLDSPVEPVKEVSFFECLDTATEKSQELARSMQDITTSLKKEDADTLAEAVGGASDAVCQLTESTAQVCFSMFTFCKLVSNGNICLSKSNRSVLVPSKLCKYCVQGLEIVLTLPNWDFTEVLFYVKVQLNHAVFANITISEKAKLCSKICY